jgi:hypothetical protein
MKYLPGEEEIIYHLARRIIAGVSGHPMSGLWTLVFMDGTRVHIESGHGVRQLAECFGATEGKGDLQDKIRNQDVYYSVDAFGVLEAFTPADEWKGEELLMGEDIWLPESEFPRNGT